MEKCYRPLRYEALWFYNGNRHYAGTNCVFALTYVCSTRRQVPQDCRENVSSHFKCETPNIYCVGIGKVKFVCLIKHHNVKTPGRVQVWIHAILISTLDYVSVRLSPGSPPGREAGTHWLESWADHRTVPDIVKQRHLFFLPAIKQRHVGCLVPFTVLTELFTSFEKIGEIRFDVCGNFKCTPSLAILILSIFRVAESNYWLGLKSNRFSLTPLLVPT